MRGSAALVLLLVVALSGIARAAPAPTLPASGPLRLDESPALPLLDPFRHASGRPGTALGRYQRGSFGRWLERSWVTLDWLPPAPGAINPREDLTAGEPCLERFLGTPAAFPRASFEAHWFVESADPAALDVSPAIVPPWLERLDLHWAHALVLTAGCGRGGECSAGTGFPAAAFAALWEALAPPAGPTPWWVCRERPARIARHQGESESFVVLHCDGSVPAGALEKLSILARPAGVPHPNELPPEPDPRAPPGEWVPGVRLVHPRLLWVLHQLALAFPWRGIYIFSGYRVPEEGSVRGHRSLHAEGRALDVRVHGIANEDLFALCREFPDVGCGYYPNHKFVHIDVRPRGRGGGMWIDVSGPGEPSRYVDSWPGVVENGIVVHRRVKEKPWMR